MATPQAQAVPPLVAALAPATAPRPRQQQQQLSCPQRQILRPTTSQAAQLFVAVPPPRRGVLVCTVFRCSDQGPTRVLPSNARCPISTHSTLSIASNSSLSFTPPHLPTHPPTLYVLLSCSECQTLDPSLLPLFWKVQVLRLSLIQCPGTRSKREQKRD